MFVVFKTSDSTHFDFLIDFKCLFKDTFELIVLDHDSLLFYINK
jgi:hypothetical protein